MSDPNPTLPPDSPDGPDALDRALGRAFGGTSGPSPSVLRKLETRISIPLGVHVDSHGIDDTPVKITDDSRRLRDPSGRYQVLGELGRGGVGIVYKGRDQDLGRDVAMKVLKDQYADNPDVLARFVEEAQIGGQLQHPGIVPVYELGLHAGERPYFAMKLVKGDTLAAHLARRFDPSQDRRRLFGVFEQVCQTMAYAHARSVVHRDLKPANVMIGAFGEVQVVDWGFAKVLPKGGVHDEKETQLAVDDRSVIETNRSVPGSGTHSIVGSVLGTPAYMPPEQALGDIERVDERSDVFALGAILCEILTGDPPYLERDGDVVRQAATGALDGAHARIRKSGAEAALQDLAIECLARARAARPATAGDVAARISAYLTSVEERAHRAELRATEARMRQRTTVVSVVAGVVVIGLIAGGVLWMQHAAAARRASAMLRLDPAVAAASAALGKAQANGHDMVLWDAAHAAADNAVSLAQSDDLDDDVRRRTAALAEQIGSEQRAARAAADARARDDAMVQRLETLRIPIDESVREVGWTAREHGRLDAEYAAAFAAYLGDVDLLGGELERVRAALQGAISGELAIALDHWGLVRDPSAPGGGAQDATATARIRALAAMLDGGDGWRTELRSLLPSAVREGQRLRDLAARIDVARQPASAVRVLAEALLRAGEADAAVAVLQRGQEVHPQDFDLVFRLAVQLEQAAEPNWSEALAAYRIARALRPERNEVLHRLGIVLESLERREDAIRVFQTLCDREPQSSHWAAHLAQTFALAGQPARAVAVLEPLQEGAGPFGLAVLADALAEVGRYDDAIALYERFVDDETSESMLLHNYAFTLQRAHRFGEAARIYRRAIAASDKPRQSLFNLAVTFQMANDYPASIEPLRTLLANDPEDGKALTLLARAQFITGAKDEAIETARRAMEFDPKNGENYASLALELLRRGKIEEARVVFEQGYATAPENPVVLVNYGAYLNATSDPRALAICEAAVAAAPDDVGGLANLAMALAAVGRHDEALARLREAVAADPKHLPSRENLGHELLRRGDREGAIALLREGVALVPDAAESHAGLANALMAARRLDEAAAELERAAAIDPANPRVLVGRAELADRRGDEDGSADLMEQAANSFQDSGGIDTDLAGLRRQAARRMGASAVPHAQAGELDEAERRFRRAIALDPDYPQAHQDLGLLLKIMERFDEALVELDVAERLFRASSDPQAQMYLARNAAMRRQIADARDFESILDGTRRAGDATAWAAAVQSAYRAKRFRGIVALTEVTLRDAPALVAHPPSGLYNAACAAAIASGAADDELDGAERVRLRGLARDWLEREVERVSSAASGVPVALRGEWFRHTLEDEDFAMLRGDALRALPEDEAAAWRALWERIAAAAR